MDDVLLGCQLFKTHGTPGVQLLCTDADLSTKAKLVTVHEPGGGINKYSSCVNLISKTVCCSGIFGDDRLAMTRACLVYVFNRLIKVINDPYRELEI